MPTYSYTCVKCRKEWDMRDVPMDMRETISCSTCKVVAKRIFWTTRTAPNTQSSAVTNQLFSNGRGKFDYGLGCYVYGRFDMEKKADLMGLRVISESEKKRAIQGDGYEKKEPTFDSGMTVEEEKDMYQEVEMAIKYEKYDAEEIFGLKDGPPDAQGDAVEEAGIRLAVDQLDKGVDESVKSGKVEGSGIGVDYAGSPKSRAKGKQKRDVAHS